MKERLFLRDEEAAKSVTDYLCMEFGRIGRCPAHLCSNFTTCPPESAVFEVTEPIQTCDPSGWGSDEAFDELSVGRYVVISIICDEDDLMLFLRDMSDGATKRVFNNGRTMLVDWRGIHKVKA
jgi:hypothetical protein